MFTDVHSQDIDLRSSSFTLGRTRAGSVLHSLNHDLDPINVSPDPIKSFSDPIKERLYQEVVKNGSLNYAEYGAILGVSEATIKRRLNEMKKEGVIVRVGSNKTGRWEVSTLNSFEEGSKNGQPDVCDEVCS